jgi:hypothetical protein
VDLEPSPIDLEKRTSAAKAVEPQIVYGTAKPVPFVECCFSRLRGLLKMNSGSIMVEFQPSPFDRLRAGSSGLSRKFPGFRYGLSP